MDSVDNDYVINHTRIACVYVINKHASARFDRGLDDFARLVYDVTGAVENITTGIIRAVLANNERFHRLITGGCAFLSRRCDDCSRYRYWFCGCLFLCVELVCANANGAITTQPSVTIIFFIFASFC